MTLVHTAALLAAGFLAGAINAVVGAGGLITFPVLLGIGYSPFVANISLSVGMAVGNAGAVLGYRREIGDQMPRLLKLAVPAAAGAVLGAVLLLLLPPRLFSAVVPVLVIFAVALVVAQPWLSERLQRRGTRPWHKVALQLGVFLNAVYGGYFGAAQGVILISLLTLMLADSVQRLNGLKNAIVMIVNGTAAVLFAVVAPIAWRPAALLAVSSILGARLGASLARRLSATALRGFIVVAGVATVVKLLTS